jgi:uncharacterized repeat protein (TIGR01451 family)
MKFQAIIAGLLLSCSLGVASANEVVVPAEDAGATPQWCKVEFEKIGPNEVKVGDFASYFIELENESTCTFRNLRIRDLLPERAQFVSADPEPDHVDANGGPDFGGRLEWEHILLKPNEHQFYEVRVHVVGPPNRTIVNRACLYSGDKRLACAEKKTEVTTGPAPGFLQ